jgi:hypothetical protein
MLGIASLWLIGVAQQPAVAADLKGDCCADLEARIAELEETVARKNRRAGKAELKIVGGVSRALLFWDDGARRDVFSVDNSNSGTDLKIEGDVELGGGWKVGFTVGFDVLSAPSDAVSQIDHNATGRSTPANRLRRDGLPSGFFVAESNISIEHEKRFGGVSLGLLDTASDGIDNINLSGSNTLADAGVEAWNGGFLLRAKDGTLLQNVAWGDFAEGKYMGGTVAGVGYTTPIFMGFEAGIAWGEDDFWDVALRYDSVWRNVLHVSGGIGYFSNRTEEAGDLVPKEDQGWGGSIAVLHIPTGLNFAYSTARQTHSNNCNVPDADAQGPGAVSGKCRGADTFHYFKGGLIRKIFSVGPTAFYGEYYTSRKEPNESEPDVLADLELNPGTAEELKDTRTRVWGFGVVQKFEDDEPAEKKSKKGKTGRGENGAAGENGGSEKKKRKKKEETPVEIYIGYRHYEVDFNLIDAGGPIPGKKIQDFDVIMTGLTIRF